MAELGLIEEYEFVVHPRLAGHGPTLFAGLSKRIDLKDWLPRFPTGPWRRLLVPWVALVRLAQLRDFQKADGRHLSHGC
jgi:hypothetical protein